jgi:hypothetical protein
LIGHLSCVLSGAPKAPRTLAHTPHFTWPTLPQLSSPLSRAKKVDIERGPRGWAKKFLRRYFKENLFLGLILTLIAFPVLAYFFYNIALLVVVISPSARGGLTRIVFPNAESLYIHSLQALGSWLIVVVFIPAIWLLFRGELLRWRYVIENAAMNLVFRRSVKYSILGLLGYVGCAVMHYWAASLFKFIISTGFR